MNLKKVIITGIGTSTSQNIAKALQGKAYLIGLDMDPINAGRFLVEEFHLVPAAKNPDFLPRMRQLVEDLQPDIVIPVIDYEFLVLAENDIGCKVTLASPETIKLCDDKEASIRAFHEAGVLSPEVVVPKFNYWPKMVRPQFDGRASLGAARCNDFEEWAAAAGKLDFPITTKWIRGHEITADVLCDENSDVMAFATRERLEVKSGVAHKSRLYHDPDVELEIQRICKRFKLKFLNCMQAIVDGEGNYHWFEVNPRYGGGSAATMIAGLNLPLLMLKYMTGEGTIEWEDHEYKDGVSVRSMVEYFIDD
jgi:carbamoyl-phosphate synthase large subunit